MKLKKIQARQLLPGMVVKEDWGIAYAEKHNWLTVDTVINDEPACTTITFKEASSYVLNRLPDFVFTRDLHREKLIFVKGKTVPNRPKSLPQPRLEQEIK